MKFAETMTWKGKHPVVKLITETYEKAMSEIEKQIQGLSNSTNENFPDLGRWFIDIYYHPV